MVAGSVVVSGGSVLRTRISALVLSEALLALTLMGAMTAGWRRWHPRGPQLAAVALLALDVGFVIAHVVVAFFLGFRPGRG